MTNNFINGQNFKSIFDETNPLLSINQLSDKLYELRYKANAGRNQIRTKNDLAIEYEAVKTQVEQLQNVLNSKLRYEPAKEIFEKIEESTNYLQEVLSGLDYKIVQTYYNDILDLTDDLIDLTEENTRDINVIDDVKNIQEYIKKSAKKIRNLKDFEHVLNDIPIEVKTLRKDNKTIQEITIRDPKKPLPKDSLAEYKTKNYIIKYDPEIIFDPEDVFLDFYEETIKDNVVKINKVETNNVFSRTKSSSIIDQIEKQGKNKLFIRDKSKKWHQYNPFNNDRNFINNLPIVTNKLINEDTVSYYNIPNIFGFLNTTLTNKDLLRFKNVIKKTNIEKRLIPLTRVDIPNNELIKQITGLPQVSTPEQFKMGIYESDKIKINFEPVDLITERTSKISKNPKYNFLGFTGNLRIDINDKRLFDKLKNNKFITENYELIDKDNSRSLIIKNFKLSKQDVDVVEKVMESNRKGIVSPITEGRISRFSNVLNRLGIRSNKPLWSKNESGLFFDIETVGNKNLSIGFARYLSPTSNQDFKISILNQNLSDEELSAVIRTKSLDEYSNIGNIIQRMRTNKLTNIEFNGIHYYLQDLDSPESIDEVFKRIKQDINVDFFKPNIQNFIGGYNIKDFDIPILQQKLGQSKAISNLLRLPVTDVYDNIQGLLQRKGINLTSYSQENVQKALGININKLHVDIHDAITTAEIAKKISNLKPFNFKELFTKFIVNTGLSKEIINTDISQTGVKTNYHSSRYFSKKNKRDEIYYSDLAEEFLNRNFSPNMFGRNYNVIKDKKHNFYTEYKGKNFINVQKDYAGNFSLFESYNDSSKLFATNAILQKQNELKYYDQAEFIKTKMELRRKINLNKRHEPLNIKLSVPIEDVKVKAFTPTYEIKLNSEYYNQLFFRNIPYMQKTKNGYKIRFRLIESKKYKGIRNLIDEYFRTEEFINLSKEEYMDFINELKSTENYKEFISELSKKEMSTNLNDTIKYFINKYNDDNFVEELSNINKLIQISVDEDIEYDNLIEERIQENQEVVVRKTTKTGVSSKTLIEPLLKTDATRLQFLVHYPEFKQTNELQSLYNENLNIFKTKFTKENLTELIKQLKYISAGRYIKDIGTKKQLKLFTSDLTNVLGNKTFDYNHIVSILQKNSNIIDEILYLGLIKKNNKRLIKPFGINITETDIDNIKNLLNKSSWNLSSSSSNQIIIKNYRFNQVLNLIDYIKDENLKTKFQQFATERIQQLYDTNQQKFISTFMSNVQQFIINYQTYNKLNSFNQETSWNEQISKQIYDLEYMPNNELIKLDYNSLSNQGLLKMYIDIQKGNKFRSFYKQQLEQIEGQKGVVEFEFNNQKFRINQSKQPKNPVERLKWFIKNYESKSNYRYGKNTINNYVLSELFRGKEIFDVKNLEFMDFILNLKSYSPTQIEEKIQKFIDVGLLKGNPLISKLPGKKYTDAFENENIKVLIADILEQVNEKYYDLTLNEYILLKNNNDPNLFTSLLEPLVHNKKRNFLDDFFEINNITEDEMLETLADPSSIRPIFLSVQEFYGENIRKGFLTKELKIKNQKISNYKINELIFSHFYNQAQNSDFKQPKTLIENLQTLNEMFHRGGKKDYTKYIEQTKTRKNLVFDLQDIINDVINSKEKNVKTNDITNFFSNKQFIDKFQEFFVQKKFYSNIYEDLDKNDYLMSFIDKKTEELFGDINIKSKKYSIIENKYKDLLYKHVGRNKRQANTIIDDELNVVFKDYFKTLNQYKQLLYEFLDKNEKQTNQIITNEIIRKIKYHKKLNPNISKLFNKYALDELKEINPQLYNELITKLTKDFDITKYNEHIMLNYKVGDTIYIDGKPQIIKEINPITGIKVQKGGKIYTLVDNKKTSAKGNYQDILVNEAKQIKQINEELKPFVENLEKFQPKISEADNFFKFHAVAREQIRYYKRNSEYMSLFINNKEKIQKQIGLDPNSDVMNNLIKFLQTHKDLISQYSLSNQQVDEYLRNNFIQKEEIPELTSYLSPTNLQKIRGYVKTNATLDKTNVQVSIKGHLETSDVKIIEKFINQLSIFNDINELFKSGNTTKDYLKKLNEIEDLNKTDDVLETKIIIKNLDNYVENLRRVFEINDKRLNELFNLYYSQSTNKQKLYLVNQIEHNLAINKNSVVWNLIGQENFKTINDFLEEHSDNVINNIRYLYQLLKEKSNSKTKLDDEILYFIQNIMSRSYQKKIPNTIIQKHIYSNGLENQEIIIPMSEDLLGKETNRKINEPTFQEMLNKLVNPDEESIKEAIQKSQMEKNLNKINYKKLGALGQGIAAVTGLITLGTVQKRKQEKKQQTVYPQQVQANGDYYLNQELPNPEYGFDIRQLQQMPDQAVEELIYQLSDLKRDKLVNLYKTYQF